jgi:hypothetical protein
MIFIKEPKFMKQIITVVLTMFAAFLISTPAKADVVNFDNLATGVIVTTQYPQVTFSSTAGSVNRTVSQNLGSSLPNFICTGPASGPVDCTHETILDFTSPVNNLSFLAVGVNDMGVVALVDVFQSGVFSTTVNVIGHGVPLSSVDLSAFSNVTRIRIHSITDTVGIGWDDFTFNGTGPAPVPEPATMMLFGTGLAGVVVKLRKRIRRRLVS